MKVEKHRIVLFVIVIALAIMPFFWFAPGEMDLGGDGGRLHFYDPINVVKNLGPYYVLPSATGKAEAHFFYLPFISILAGLNQIVDSSYILISVHNAIKIVVGFLAVYAIIKEVIGKSFKRGSLSVEFASILAGLFYLSTPAMIGNYSRAIDSHDQVFLNPLMFYLILRFFLTGNMRYIWVGLLVSLVFATNFNYSAAPPFFAFYPLAILFIVIYTVLIRKISIPWKKLILGIVFFLGLQAFHFIPEALDTFTAGSNISDRLSRSDISRQLDYFYAVLGIPKISFHLLSYYTEKQLAEASIVIPFIIVLGLLLNKRREKTILLAGVFFLLTLFLVTAKITNASVKLYELLFYIPGFTMFRNFYGQWQFVFSFFYSLLFGLAIFSILSKIKLKIVLKAIFLALSVFFAISSWRFIDGTLTNPFYEGAKNVKIAIKMDPEYEETLTFIRSLQDDGKILILPFTDFYIQVIHGLNDGAYIGSSTIGRLTGKKDFAGYQDVSPYSEIFWQLSKERDFEGIKKLLGLLNIRYIFHNSDTRIYDKTFTGRPYSAARKYMPQDQKGYIDFISHLSSNKIYERIFYNIYKIEDEDFLPHFYTASGIFSYRDDPEIASYGKASLFFQRKIDAKSPVYIENKTCRVLFSEEICGKEYISVEDEQPKIHFEKINPTKYRVKVFEAKDPYILVFSEAFHKNWKLFISAREPQEEKVVSSYFDGQIQEGRHKNIFLDKNTFETLNLKPLDENSHFVANGYANAWYIDPQYTKRNSDYELIVEMTGQRNFYASLALSGITFGIFLTWGARLFLPSRKKKTSIIKSS